MMSRILIVEDEPLIAMLLEDWLRELGHDTLGPASDVDQALKLLDEAGCDAAILDVSLGSQNCYPVAEHLSRRNIPFALATGHASPSVDPRFQGREVLSKPYDFAAVERTIARLTKAT